MTVYPSLHNSVNSCQGKTPGQDGDIIELTEEQICKELNLKGVNRVRRFTTEKAGNSLKLNTFIQPFFRRISILPRL